MLLPLSPHRRAVAVLLLATLTTRSYAFLTPSLHRQQCYPSQSKTPPSLILLSSKDNTEIERLKQSASQLRAEALAARQKLDAERSSRVTPAVAAASSTREVVEYDAVANSCWEVTYRFADEPESKDAQTQQQPKPRTFYSGKIQLQFKSDGYTNIINNNDDPDDNNRPEDNNKMPTFEKVWGWDLETSNEDSLEYLLFSADISLPSPSSDSKVRNMPERFYFQAQVDTDATSDKIALRDGSVTVKRNIESATGGWWGLFRGADGILAEFRSVGEFRCRAVAVSVDVGLED